ncbi:MAG TPA: hypothetical protein VGK30_13645 [Candidatus Binatia bacterium]|jgi:hypothetical protein
MRTLVPLLLVLVAVGTQPALGAETIFPGSVARPNNKGDQVIFYYDVRDGFTTFLNLRNETTSSQNVVINYYGPDFAAPFTQTVTLPAVPGDLGKPGSGGLAVIDVGSLKAQGLPATPGVAIATGVNAAAQPVVTRGLSGNFTVANLATNSAWGSPGAARSAIHPPPPSTGDCTPSQPAVTLGTGIDGTNVVLTPIQPGTADLPAYFNPATLAPAALGGNQLIFVSFVDVPGASYAAAAAMTTWTITGVQASGAPIPKATFDVTGISVSDLVSVAGAVVQGSSGALMFNAPASAQQLNRFIFFTETLGTFSTGYLLPRR